MNYWGRHLNKFRWFVLISIFLILILLPFIHLYQTYAAAFAYDFLTSGEKMIYDSMEWLTSPFTKDPVNDLNAIKGTTWAGNIFGFKISDPLAVVGQTAAGHKFITAFAITAIVPVLFTIIFGRFYCGWICPATFLYELNDNLGTWLRHFGLPISHKRLDGRLKYVILVTGIFLCAISGSMLFAAIYPPAIIGREIYFGIAVGGFGIGMVFFIITLFFDLLVSRRGFCRYLCPGGALYSLLGRFRLVRIQRVVKDCNDCAKCNAACQFGLDPLRDNFGQECNNCSACIAVCPTDALKFKITIKDQANQGKGHLSHTYKKEQG